MSALLGTVSNKVRTFAILSPDNLRTFKATLESGAIQYAAIEGNGEKSEHSFMLFNIPLSTASSLAKTYQQESFFFGQTKKEADGDSGNTASITAGFYRTDDGGKTYTLVEESGGIAGLEDLNEFFSGNGAFGYRLTMDIFESAKEIKDMEALEMSLDEKYCGRYQMRYRAYSTNGFRLKEAPIPADDLTKEETCFKGPFWVLGSSIDDIKLGNFKLDAYKVPCDFDGNIIEGEERTHSQIMDDYDYYPRGRVGVYKGTAYINIHSILNQPDIIDEIIDAFNLSSLKIVVKHEDSKAGHHYGFKFP